MKRKTRTREEISAACRRASLARKHCRGGRPRSEGERPSKSVKVRPFDYAVLRNVAAANRLTLAAVIGGLLSAFVNGTSGPLKPHPQYRP